jgi:LmbE family N-acetylglucosaminyl deacetylase
LVVVAHPDDDLLFLSPDILTDLKSDSPFTTIYVTSGDSGRGQRYLRSRERGVAAAYARMVGVSDYWSIIRVAISGHTCVQFQSRDAPRVTLVFIRLPDGLSDGRGTATSGGTSLEGLLLGRTSHLTTVAHPVERYSSSDLLSVLGRLMDVAGPQLIRTLDCEGDFGDGDHSDHHAVARFVRVARDVHLPGVRMLAFAGYTVQDRPPNVAPPQLAEKVAALAVYADFDMQMCDPQAACEGRLEPVWLRRQYLVLDLPGVGDAMRGDEGPLAACRMPQERWRAFDPGMTPRHPERFTQVDSDHRSTGSVRPRGAGHRPAYLVGGVVGVLAGGALGAAIGIALAHLVNAGVVWMRLLVVARQTAVAGVEIEPDGGR